MKLAITTITSKSTTNASQSTTSHALQFLIAELLGLTCLVLDPICFANFKS